MASRLMLRRGVWMYECSRSLHTTSFVWHRSATPRWVSIPKPCTDPDQQDPDYFEKEAAKVPLNATYVDSLDKLYKEKTSVSRDLFFKREDGLVKHDSRYWLPIIDESQPRLPYRRVDALKTAPESVKRLFSIEHGERSALSDAWKAAIVGLVQRNKLDSDSFEARTLHTALIRHWTALFDHLYKTSRYWKKPKQLLELVDRSIGRRRKLLRQLRERDSASFERVLADLRIAYHVPALPEDQPSLERKGWIMHQLRRRIEDEKQRRRQEYAARLKEERRGFVENKERRLAEMDAEERRVRAELHALSGGDGALKPVGVFEANTVNLTSENNGLAKHFPALRFFFGKYRPIKHH